MAKTRTIDYIMCIANASRWKALLVVSVFVGCALIGILHCLRFSARLTRDEPAFGWAFLLLGAVFIALLTGLAVAKRKDLPLEYVFLILFGPLSLCMMVAMPMFGAPDEELHLSMSYVVSSGQMFSASKQVDLPCNMHAAPSPADLMTIRESLNCLASGDDFADDRMRMKLNEQIRVYPALAYLPQGISMGIVRCLFGNRYASFYAARLGSIFVSALMLFFAIRWTPCGKNIILAASVFPMSLQETASASCDGLAIACVTLLCAFVLRSRLPGFSMSWRHWVVACLLAVGLVCFKVFYIPFLAAFLLVGKEACNGRRWRLLVLVACAAAAALFSWWILSIRPLMNEDASRVSTQVMAQLAAIRSDSLLVPKILLKTFAENAEIYIRHMVGISLSWFNAQLPYYVNTGVIAATFAIVLKDRSLCGMPGEGLVRFVFFTLTAVSAAMVALSLLVWWTAPGSETIGGIQGRYFLPLFFAGALSLGFADRFGTDAYPKLWVCHAFLLFFDVCALAALVSWKI